MNKESSPHENKNAIISSIITGGALGLIIGTPINIWINFGFINFSSFAAFLSQITLDQIIIGSILWIIAGGILGVLLLIYNTHESAAPVQELKQDHIKVDQHNQAKDKVIIPLREEQLKIYKEWVKTADISVSKETITEEKKITVPVLHEYLVIRKKDLTSKAFDGEDTTNDTIRIHISEERFDISKHKITLEDVKISKREFQDIKHIEVTLKKEKLHMDTTENAIVLNKNDNSPQ
jgi:uncharacterized protein (TIGR02271 family)